MDGSKTASEVLKMLLRDFYYLKYEEFMLCFRMMKEGKFGSYYGKLGMAEFQRCFTEFDAMEERTALWESHHSKLKMKVIEEYNDDDIDYEAFKKRMKEDKVWTKDDEITHQRILRGIRQDAKKNKP